MEKIEYTPIGVIHSPFKEPKGVPIQPITAKNTKGIVEVYPEYSEGLQDLEGFSHIILIYHLHLSRKTYSLKVKPYMDDQLRGLFSTRAPTRPNPIGISTVELVKIKKNILYIKNIDIVDGTPLLDIKPYVPEMDIRKTKKIGWLEKNIHKLSSTKDDGRFKK